MNIVDELIAQRDAVLFGEWVPRAPTHAGEACAVVRIGTTRKVEWLSDKAQGLLYEVYRVSSYRKEGIGPVGFNNSGVATREDILELLDEAIRVAKDQENAS